MTDSARTERRLIDSIRRVKDDGTRPAAAEAAATPPTTAATPEAPPHSKGAGRQGDSPIAQASTPLYQFGRRVWPD